MSKEDWLRFCREQQHDEDTLSCEAAFEDVLDASEPAPLSRPPTQHVLMDVPFAWSDVFPDDDGCSSQQLSPRCSERGIPVSPDSSRCSERDADSSSPARRSARVSARSSARLSGRFSAPDATRPLAPRRPRAPDPSPQLTAVLRARYLTPLHFHTLMLDPHSNGPVARELARAEEAELDQPLAHYFVAASHNTYLMDQDQLAGTSCVDMYRRVLLAGCRSVELDVWDGEEGEPIVTHGRTLCTKIKFEACVKAIAEAAFVNNPYPVSLSLEIRCSRRQQSRVAAILRTHLGDALLLPDDVPAHCSPKSLQRRILIKGKAAARHLPLREIDEMDETGGERAARPDAARTANARARLKLHRCGAEPPRTAVDISPPRDARQEGGVKLDPATGKFTMDNVPPEMRAVLEEIESSRRSRAPEMRAVLDEMEKTTSAKEVGSSSAGDGSDGEVVVGGGVEGGGGGRSGGGGGSGGGGSGGGGAPERRVTFECVTFEVKGAEVGGAREPIATSSSSDDIPIAADSSEAHLNAVPALTSTESIELVGLASSAIDAVDNETDIDAESDDEDEAKRLVRAVRFSRSLDEPLDEPPAQPPRLVQLFIDRLRHVDVETATAEALLLGDEREENVAERSSTRGIPKTAERSSSRGIPTSLTGTPKSLTGSSRSLTSGSLPSRSTTTTTTWSTDNDDDDVEEDPEVLRGSALTRWLARHVMRWRRPVSLEPPAVEPHLSWQESFTGAGMLSRGSALGRSFASSFSSSGKSGKGLKSRRTHEAADEALVRVIAMPSRPREEFLSPLSVSFGRLSIVSFSEGRLLAHLNGKERSGEGERDSMAFFQRRTVKRLARVFPSASRVASSNMDPLLSWRAGVQLVALNLQTVDLPTQLHYALFERGGGFGYVLKPAEMREPHHVPSDAEIATTADGKAEDAPTANAKSWRESAGRDSAPDGYISGDLTRGMAVRLRGGPKTTEEHAAEASPRLMRLTRLTEHATEEPPRTAVDISPPRDARQEGGVKLDPATGKFTMDNVRAERRAVLEEIESSRRSRAPEMRAVLEKMEKTTSAKEACARSTGDSLNSVGGSCRIGLCADHLVDGLPLPAAELPLVEQRTSRRARVRPPPPVPMPELPVLWPPPRTTVRRASIRVLALYHLPTRREARPQLQGGAHSASLRCVPELNGPCSPPEAGATPSSPSVSISLHAIGGFCRVSQDNPPTEDAGTAFSTSAAIANGLNPVFHELVHCLAAEPNETVLKLGIVDADVEVAFATVVLGLLRPGYRSVQLRSRHGMRIWEMLLEPCMQVLTTSPFPHRYAHPAVLAARAHRARQRAQPHHEPARSDAGDAPAAARDQRAGKGDSRPARAHPAARSARTPVPGFLRKQQQQQQQQQQQDRARRDDR